ncbi:MAG: InlB B-repeat-containing protein [Oscillospiraceae bacterium]|nr:InlB B-repeat-containing protein [Oscillospiraceae bacterium]
MKKRVIALALCLVMLATCLGAGILAPTPVKLVDENGAAATSAAVPQLGRETLTASYADATETTGYQWQFSNDGDTWIDIYGETAQTCSLSYAKVKNMLDADGEAQLRCVVTDGEDERISSAATVTVDYSAQTAEAQSGGLEKAAPARAASYTRSAAPMNADAPTTYNVVINYLFENNAVAADPYTANLAAGSNFSTTVTFPTVQGYLPYVNDERQDSIDLNYTAIDKDYTINVVYKPTNVNYTVIHYQQNLNDDKYTEFERETKQGLTNSTVPEVAKSYEGFYALLYEKPAIAADGSTVVEIYYDRYYYLMNFDLDGGYGVEPIYARFGAPISVGTPTKAGYSFTGWSLDGTNTVDLPTTMPAENRTYKAVWTADDTAKVTIVFWGENADNEEYSYIRSQQINVKPGTEFTYTVNGVLTCTEEEHDHIASGCTLICKDTHTHTLACYGLKSSDKNDMKYWPESDHLEDFQKRYGSFTSGMVYMYDGILDNYYYLYFEGSWYKASSALGSDGEMAKAVKCTYSHTHSDACYGCGKTAHTHTSDCYMSGAGLDSNLWKFVRSDTVTVAADGSSVVNVYYDRVEKTLTFKYNYSNRKYQSTETIAAKWGADISTQYKAIATNAKSTFWSAETSGDGPYTNYFGIMPQTSATYYNRGTTGSTGTMTYWGQDLNGDYTVKLFEVTGVGGYYVSDEDRYEFQGFTYHHGTSNGSSCSGAKFYYTRNSYTLTFNDGYKDVKKESVKYEASLSTYKDYEPVVPSAYEPGSVTFGGWYLNPECTGAEYKLAEHNMPADNVLLYAKWVPVTHTVEFYLNKDALDAGTKLSTHPDITVSHGSKADPTPADPTNGSYTFVGWFYMENGVEKAFDFANMPVNKDMQVYGKWSSNVLKSYFIYYKYKDADGKEIEIAAPTTGSGLAGVTKTFEAKGGSDLYADYQEGYFPVTKSHSLTLDIDNNANNVFTFWYVQKEAVPYTVKYLNKETGEPVATEKTVSDNRKAVVTETFKPVSGMMPDAYQKRLVVSAEEDAVNEIIFYYTEDTTHAYYKITHYTENLGTDSQGKPTWTEYASSQAVGDIGKTYTAEPMTIPGFTCDRTVEGTLAGGKLTANGLELKLYYTRNSYPYQVRYLEQGTGKQLAAPKDGTGKYGQVVSESAKDIENYDAVAPTSQTLNIRIEEGTEAKLNIITFYYTEKEVTINYQVVGPAGCGTVTPASETLKVLTGTAQGSTAAVSSETYRFVGWYKDKECTQLVDSSWVDANNKLTPVKNADDAWTAATYYAKFEYNLTDLKITKTATPYDANDMFIFTVKHGDDVVAKVTLKAGESVTIKNLTVGETYTVTEDNNWSWRYKDVVDQTITLEPTGNEVTVNNTLEKNNWLGASSYAINRCVESVVTRVVEAVESLFG